MRSLTYIHVYESIVDMSRPVFRYMTQKQFEKAPLSQLMERITQMRVVPDLLPLDVAPTVQVNIKLDNDTIVEPGVFIKPEQVRRIGSKRREREMDVDLRFIFVRACVCPRLM